MCSPLKHFRVNMKMDKIKKNKWGNNDQHFSYKYKTDSSLAAFTPPNVSLIAVQSLRQILLKISECVSGMTTALLSADTHCVLC